ncbi:MAG: hypothetical protein Q9160_003882 [Pyrenula sp. 1 TL-2023]
MPIDAKYYNKFKRGLKAALEKPSPPASKRRQGSRVKQRGDGEPLGDPDSRGSGTSETQSNSDAEQDLRDHDRDGFDGVDKTPEAKAWTNLYVDHPGGQREYKADPNYESSGQYSNLEENTETDETFQDLLDGNCQYMFVSNVERLKSGVVQFAKKNFEDYLWDVAKAGGRIIWEQYRASQWSSLTKPG